MKIKRVLLWFQDGDEMLNELNERFYGLSVMLTRLLNAGYDGKKIKFINIQFYTPRTYEMYPVLPKDSPYCFGDELTYYGTLDIDKFMKLSPENQKKEIWEKACHYLNISGNKLKNQALSEAAEHAQVEGVKRNLNPDYRMLDSKIEFKNEQFRASIWVLFQEREMLSKLTLEKDGKVVFEKVVDKTKAGVEIFLEMYKSIDVNGDNIIVKGRKDVQNNLPLKIQIDIGE